MVMLSPDCLVRWAAWPTSPILRAVLTFWYLPITLCKVRGERAHDMRVEDGALSFFCLQPTQASKVRSPMRGRLTGWGLSVFGGAIVM